MIVLYIAPLVSVVRTYQLLLGHMIVLYKAPLVSLLRTCQLLLFILFQDEEELTADMSAELLGLMSSVVWISSGIPPVLEVKNSIILDSFVFGPDILLCWFIII